MVNDQNNLNQAALIGAMQADIKASQEDRRGIKESMRDLVGIAADNKTIMFKLDSISHKIERFEEKTESRIEKFEEKIEVRMKAMEINHAAAGGAMKVVIGIATIIGTVVGGVITAVMTYFYTGKH